MQEAAFRLWLGISYAGKIQSQNQNRTYNDAGRVWRGGHRKSPRSTSKLKFTSLKPSTNGKGMRARAYQRITGNCANVDF